MLNELLMRGEGESLDEKMFLYFHSAFALDVLLYSNG